MIKLNNNYNTTLLRLIAVRFFYVYAIYDKFKAVEKWKQNLNLKLSKEVDINHKAQYVQKIVLGDVSGEHAAQPG